MLAKGPDAERFRGRVGHRFNFATKPMGGWDGVVPSARLLADDTRGGDAFREAAAGCQSGYGSKLNSILDLGR